MMTYARWFLLAFAATAAVTAYGDTKKYPLPDNTTLVLSVPPGWKDELRAKEGSTPATIFLTPNDGTPFQVFVTPVGRAKPDAGTAAQMRQSVQESADKVKPRAVESVLAVAEFTGATGPGYYFSATDSAPPPGEFKYLTQGMLLVGEVVVSFGVLTNDGQEKVKDQALSMLKNAAVIK